MKIFFLISVLLFSFNAFANNSFYCEAYIYKSSSEQPERITLKRRNIRSGFVFRAQSDDFKFSAHLGFPSADNLTFQVESTGTENFKLVTRHSVSQIEMARQTGYDHGKPSLHATLSNSNTVHLSCYLK